MKGAAALRDVAPGTVIAGYRVEGLIGRGGMGEVYRAHQLALDRPVALKLIASDLARDERFAQRFRQEALIAARIDHPNVLPVHEAGQADGRLYLSMRLVDGVDLAHALEEGPLDPDRAVRVVTQVAAALDAAHARGLVHRDVKPANILLEDRDGVEHAYLTDFGLAKAVDASGPTKTGHVVGTVNYLAPEQITAGRSDARSDVYSLGCVLYQCLTGAPPFARATDVATLWAHVNDPTPTPTSSVSTLPSALDDVIGRALAKDADRRYGSAGELAVDAAAAARRPRAQPTRRRGRTAKHAVIGALVAAAVVALALVTAFALPRDDDGGPADASVASTGGSAPTDARAAEAAEPAPSTVRDPATVGSAQTTGVAEAAEAAVAPSPASGVFGAAVQLAAPPLAIEVGEDAVWALDEHGALYELDPAGNSVRGEPLDLLAGRGPDARATDIAFDERRNWIWALVGTQVVSIDAATRETVAEAELRPNQVPGKPATDVPYDVEVAGDSIWVAVQGPEEASLHELLAASPGLVGPPIALGPEADRMTVTASGVWLATDGTEMLHFDPATRSVTRLEVDGTPLGVAGAAGGRVWMTYGGYQSVAAIDTATGAEDGASLWAGGDVTPSLAVLGEELWTPVSGVGSPDGVGLAVIDIARHQQVAVVPHDELLGPISAGAAGLWVGGSQTNSVRRIDPAEARALLPGDGAERVEAGHPADERSHRGGALRRRPVPAVAALHRRRWLVRRRRRSGVGDAVAGPARGADPLPRTIVAAGDLLAW